MIKGQSKERKSWENNGYTQDNEIWGKGGRTAKRWKQTGVKRNG